jgi:non-ribosomal peptide synthetase component F
MMAAMMRSWETLVGAALRDPSVGIHLVPVVSEQDADVLVRQWNDTHADFTPMGGEPQVPTRIVRRRLQPTAPVCLELNIHPAPCFPSAGIHELFERNADLTPGQVAVVGPSHDKTDSRTLELTYGDLERRANQLCRHLQARGVAPGAIVGILLERCTTFYVAMLATLKAGAAYVSIDPEYPDDRIEYMLQVRGAAR